jgi:hypothetical protein
MRLDEPAGLSSLTSLTALHACGLRSKKHHDLLDVLPSLHKLRYLDLSMKEKDCSESPRQYNDNCCHPCLDTAALERLIYGCPELEWLSIAAPPPVGGDQMQQPVPCSLLALQYGTRLTSLHLWANDRLQDSNLVELARVTSLQFLGIRATGRDITDMGVQELTQLTALTKLCLDTQDAPMVSKEVARYSGKHGGVFMVHRTPEMVVGWTVSCKRSPHPTRKRDAMCADLTAGESMQEGCYPSTM